jgi:hypothetical protein
MNSKNLFVLNTIIAIVFGLGFLLVPAVVLSLYGVPQDPATELIARFFGTALIGLGLICWFTSDISDAAALRAIMLGLVISHTAGLIVAVVGTVSGVLNAFGWSAVILYLVLVLGYAYLLFMKPADS